MAVVYRIGKPEVGGDRCSSEVWDREFAINFVSDLYGLVGEIL